MCTLDKILELLKENGKNQKDLTDYLGLTKNAFTNWKSGQSESYKKYLPQIAQFLGVTVDCLLLGENRTSEEDLVKFSLFGTTNVPPEVYEQVKSFAKFTYEGYKNNNG